MCETLVHAEHSERVITQRDIYTNDQILYRLTRSLGAKWLAMVMLKDGDTCIAALALLVERSGVRTSPAHSIADYSIMWDP